VRRFTGAPWLYYGLAVLLVLAGILSQIEIRVPSRPLKTVDALATLRDRDDVNVIFLLVDTLRADHLGVYGYERDTSPTLDQLARFGVRFAHVRAQSTFTKASMASLWTGAYPATTGVTRFNHALPDSARMPAEILRAAGFRTGGIFRNGWVAANFGFDQGFDLYIRPVPSRTRERYERARDDRSGLQGTDLDATEAAIEFVRSHARDRFFLYVHYMDAHQYLYEESFAEFGTSYADAYDNALKWTDHNVAMLVVALDELGLFEKTLLVVASDHGEAFLEHGSEGHAVNLYAEVTEVPLILSLPFRLDPGVVVEPLVRNIDIWPTVLDLLGLPTPEGADGRSLVPLVETAARGAAGDLALPREAFTHLDRSWGWRDAEPKPLIALDDDGFRLIYPAFEPERAELYDKGEDPGEHHDVSSEHAERRDALVERVRAYLAGRPADPSLEVELDEMELEQLRALGYVVHGAGQGAPRREDAK